MTGMKRAVFAILVGALTFQAPAVRAAENYQGLWWNAAESGWGINFAHQGDVIFATWFTYRDDGKPWWLIAELHKVANGRYTGSIATVAGPAFITSHHPSPAAS